MAEEAQEVGILGHSSSASSSTVVLVILLHLPLK